MGKTFVIDWENKTVEDRKKAIQEVPVGVYAGVNGAGEGVVIYMEEYEMKVKTICNDGVVTVEYYEETGELHRKELI